MCRFGERRKIVATLLEEVGLPGGFARRSRATFSGGQRQVDELRLRPGLPYLFITRAFADRIAVFQKRHLIETGVTQALFAAPYHGYTRCRPVTGEEQMVQGEFHT